MFASKQEMNSLSSVGVDEDQWKSRISEDWCNHRKGERSLFFSSRLLALALAYLFGGTALTSSMYPVLPPGRALHTFPL